MADAPNPDFSYALHNLELLVVAVKASIFVLKSFSTCELTSTFLKDQRKHTIKIEEFATRLRENITLIMMLLSDQAVNRGDAEDLITEFEKAGEESTLVMTHNVQMLSQFSVENHDLEDEGDLVYMIQDQNGDIEKIQTIIHEFIPRIKKAVAELPFPPVVDELPFPAEIAPEEASTTTNFELDGSQQKDIVFDDTEICEIVEYDDEDFFS